MPRQTHTAGRRLQESQTVLLVSKLLARGARTQTVGRLTGLSEVPIRDVYREIYGTSPTKGPSGYSPNHFVSTQLMQFHSTLAHVCLDGVLKARPHGAEAPVYPELGHLYCEAFDIYLKNLEPLTHLIEPMDFERFAHFSMIYSNQSLLAPRKCTRCSTPFVASASPSEANQRWCPACRMTQTRECSKCSTYVPMDTLDVSPKRKPMCQEHAAKYRKATFNLSQYVNSKSPSDEELEESCEPA